MSLKKQPDLPPIGEPHDRVDGRLKVTGGARYSADIPVDNLLYAYVITSTVANGRIRSMDTGEAEKLPGVIAILTPFNAPRIPRGSIEQQGRPAGNGGGEGGSASGQQKRPPERKIHVLQETDVYYSGQPIGIVVADTYERAVHAAWRVRTHYEIQRPET